MTNSTFQYYYLCSERKKKQLLGPIFFIGQIFENNVHLPHLLDNIHVHQHLHLHNRPRLRRPMELNELEIVLDHE